MAQEVMPALEEGGVMEEEGGPRDMRLPPEQHLQQLRLSCVSLAVEAVRTDPNSDRTDVLPLAEKMYGWVKNG